MRSRLQSHGSGTDVRFRFAKRDVCSNPAAFAAPTASEYPAVSSPGACASELISNGICAAAASFLQLVTIRIAVAIGEAGCTPPAHSLIADYFSRAERPRAVSIFMLSSPVSVLIGYFIAGWLNEFYGWRATFLLLGLPGVALALVIWFTLREPRRAKSTMRSSQATPALACAQDTSSADPPALRTVCKVLWANSTFRHVVLSFAVIYFFGSGIGLWQPAFFIRSFGLQTGEIGTWFAVIWGIGGFVGTYWGGVAASRYAANNERLQLIAMAVMYCAFAVISSFIYLSSNRFVAFGLMGLAAVGIGTTYGTLFATIQALVPERMRAVAVAAVFFFANLVGHGMGPLAAGALSDALQPWVGQESLRYSLLVMCPGYAWAAWHLWRASATVAHDIQKHASA